MILRNACLVVVLFDRRWLGSRGVAAQQACDGNGGASSLPSARFQDNGDGTVTDVESKLMWMRCASGQQWLGKRCVGRC